MHRLLQVALLHILLLILLISASLARPSDDELGSQSRLEELAVLSNQLFEVYKDGPNEPTPVVVNLKPPAQHNNHDFDFEQWNTLTICTVIAAITFLLVWVIFWLIFHTESVEFQKTQQNHTNNVVLKNYGAESHDTPADNRKSTASSKSPDAKASKKKSNKNAKKQPMHALASNTISGARVTHSIALMPLPRILENNGNGNPDETQELFIAESCEDVAVQCEDEDADFDCETISGKNVDNLSNINLYHGSTVGSTGTVSQIVVQLDESYENIPIN